MVAMLLKVITVALSLRQNRQYFAWHRCQQPERSVFSLHIENVTTLVLREKIFLGNHTFFSCNEKKNFLAFKFKLLYLRHGRLLLFPPFSFCSGSIHKHFVSNLKSLFFFFDFI